MPAVHSALLFLIFIFVIAGCGNSKDSAEKTPGHIAEARDRFGEDFACEPNTPEDYILCVHHPDTTALSPIPRVAFFVFDMAAAQVVLERGEITGEVRWTAGYEIELILTPGIVTTDGRGAPKYRIDVRSGDRRRLDGTDPIPQ